MNKHWKRNWLTCTILAAALAGGTVGIGGCTPKGDTGGRVDPYRSTPADQSSKEASIPDLLQFCDQTAAALAQELADIPEIAEARDRPILELGDLSNKTYSTPTTDFELIQRRLRGQLMESKLMRQKFKIVEGRQRMDRELDRVAGSSADRGGSDITNRYQPGQTLVLLGDFYEAKRDHRSQYYFEFTLTNLQSRELLFSKRFDAGRVKQPPTD